MQVLLDQMQGKNHPMFLILIQNLALSENRAKVILNYLVSKGIDEDRLLYKGYGGTKPVATNDSEDNKKKNRRVEIVGIQ